MNEKIKQLAEQAFNQANDGTINDIKIPKEFIEKFAELIVKECADIVENEGRFLKYDRLVKKIRNTYIDK